VFTTLLAWKLQSHDYAILPVLARLGLRGAEAAAMRLGDTYTAPWVTAVPLTSKTTTASRSGK
jgi:hypothetical protein